jgi:ATP-dependent DNA ligase
MKTIGKKASDYTVIAGELFAIGPRPRVGDITSLLSENGDVRKIVFSAFDLLQGGNVETIPEDYGERHAILEELLEGGKRVKAVSTVVCSIAGEVSALFT